MKRYPAYKDSGIEWLGEVPEGWEVKPLWAMFRRVKRTGYPDAELLSVYRDFGVVPKASRDDNFNNASDDLSQYQLVEIGDLAINKMKAWQGSVAISDFTGIVSPAYFIFSPKHAECSRYLHYLMRAGEYAFAYKSRSKGIRPNQWDLEPQEHSRIGILLPPLPEQRAIANFLDREVAKIDDLVAVQRRLIALLAEKRQAIISHAVTRGLNPSAPLKPSGVDWLGDIPEGWEVVPLKKVIEQATSGPRGWSDLLGGEKAVFFQSQNIGREMNIDLSDAARLDPPADMDASRSKLCQDDTVVCITGGRTGAVAHVNELSELAFVNQHVCLLRPKKVAVAGRWLAYCLFSQRGQEQLLSTMYGLKQGLSLEQVTSQMDALPPREEQSSVVTYLDKVTGAYSEFHSSATAAITLLQERRAALISAAVTGKIDVRETQVAPTQTVHVSAMVAGLVIAGHWRQTHFGRVKLQKFLYLAQTHAGITEIGGEFLREAAGPLDRKLREQVENELTTAGAIDVEQEQGPGTAVRYKFLGDAAALRSDLGAAIGARMEAFQQLIDRLGDLDTRGIEAVATLYAAWNDLLIDGQTPSKADIIREVLENWHPQKPDKFTANDLGIWLGWMHRQDILPKGTGRKTHTGRLFV